VNKATVDFCEHKVIRKLGIVHSKFRRMLRIAGKKIGHCG